MNALGVCLKIREIHNLREALRLFKCRNGDIEVSFPYVEADSPGYMKFTLDANRDFEIFIEDHIQRLKNEIIAAGVHQDIVNSITEIPDAL